jgi:hypothetical protein
VTWLFSVLHVPNLASTSLPILLMIHRELSSCHIILFVLIILGRWLYRRNIVVDGNFSLEHMKMKRPGQDVFLNDGCGYMVQSAPYKQHLQNSTESTQVSIVYSESVFTANLQCNSAFILCQPQSCQSGQYKSQKPASNRCWCMCMCTSWMFCSTFSCGLSERREVSSLTSIQIPGLKSSRQVNMDYSICQGLGYKTSGLKGSLVIYDVACQWCILFEERVKKSKHLQLPEDLGYIAAVGKFHLAAHREGCFAHYSLNFVEGAGQQDGEVLETLWASMNKAAGSIRAMTLPHRQEMMDAHMQDSNWKKYCHIGNVMTPDSSMLGADACFCSEEHHTETCKSCSSFTEKFRCLQ